MPVPSQSFDVKLYDASRSLRTFRIDLDSGATVSFIRLDLAKLLQINISPNGQLAILADKKSRMQSLGEVDILVIEDSTGHIVLRLRALVVENLGVHCYGGQTLHLDNQIVGDVSQKTISFHGGRFKIIQSTVHAVAHPPPVLSLKHDHGTATLSTVSATEVVCTSPDTSSTPDQFESEMNVNSLKSKTIAIKPSKYLLPLGIYDIKVDQEHASSNTILIVPQPPVIPANISDPESLPWSPQICSIMDGKAQYVNFSETAPLQHEKNVHFQAIPVSEISMVKAEAISDKKLKLPALPNTNHSTTFTQVMSEIKVNKGIMSPAQLSKFEAGIMSNLTAFDENLAKGYDNEDDPHEASFSFRQENKAPPYKVWVPQFNRKCQAILQSKCDELERAGVLADPKKHNVDIRHVSPCFIQQKARAKSKPLETCELSEVRFITCFNVLNDSIHPVSGRSKSYNDILAFMSRHKFLIFADLYNSYFQIRMNKKHWKYLGVMTPHRGLKIMTRCGQGLLNSDVELDQVLAKVLGDAMTAGHCLAARDDLFVGGATIDEALENWNSILGKLASNNLKITARKVRVFMGDTEVFGHRVTNGQVKPSQHNINSLAKTTTEELQTVRQVNGWKGLYKTLIRHLPNLSHFMSPFDTICGGKASSSRFDWTKPGILEAFNAATNQLENIHATFLPHPSEQLFLMPDTSKSNLCTGWGLYAKRKGDDKEEEKLVPVQYASAKLPPYMATWAPCELEGAGSVVAIDQVRHFINESNLTTIVLADNKPVVDAANLMKIGRHSRNSRLQSLLTSVNRSNITFKHNSAKAGLHVVADAASRHRTTCGLKTARWRDSYKICQMLFNV